MNRRRFGLQKGGSQEHISLLTIMFCFNEFAFTVQVKHKLNSTQILGVILICLYFTTGHFHTCVLCKECSLFPSRLCRLLWGYHFHFVDSSHASNSSVIPVPSWHVSNTSVTGLLNWQTFCFSCQHLEVLGMSIPSSKPLKQLYKEHN